MKQPTILLLLAFMLHACQSDPSAASESNSYPIIPKPQQLTPKQGQFTIDKETRIVVMNEDEGLKAAATQLGTDMNLDLSDTKPEKDVIVFELDPSLNEEEGYQLIISPYDISIRAKTGAGAFYAVQTLKQLRRDQNGHSLFPCVDIQDAPRFSYRGMHLDVGRHFFPVETVKKYIDLLALYKFNRFHWHLTEDQGWRLEIKKYPKLQEIAACRDETLIGHYNDQPQQFDGKPYCGYYTQDEAREIVAYAAARFITVIPEIEMPGHSQAALAAYPELGCTGQPVRPATKWGVFDNVYCPNEKTFEFLEDVLTEVMDIFPSTYIHIGGDECPKTQWEKSTFCQQLIRENGLENEHGLQSYFIRRMEKFLNDHGRQIIGWDEILEGGLAPNATVMSWRGTEGGIEAARQGHDVVMTPTDYCYFDYYQSEDPNEPLAIGGYLPLEKVYGYEPVPDPLTEDEAKHILGAQGNVWTEYIDSPQKLEYMVFPRACALAEVTWSDRQSKDYDDFIGRLSHHIEMLQNRQVNVATKLYDVKTNVRSGDGMGIQVSLSPKMEGLEIRYTLDGSNPDPGSLLYSEPFYLDKSCTLQAQSFRQGNPAGQKASLEFNLHKAAGKVISLAHQPADKYSGNGNGSIINGIQGSNERYGGAEWLGFEGKDFEALINFGTETDFATVKLRFFNGKGQWIYPPKEAIAFISDDGKQFAEAGKTTVADGEGKIVTAEIDLGGKKGTYLKILAPRFGIIPAGAQGAGHEAWLFIDEIVVE